MKKLLCLILVLLLCFVLFAGCGEDKDSVQQPTDMQKPASETAGAEPEEETEPEMEPEPAPEPVTEPDMPTQPNAPVDDDSYTVTLGAFTKIFGGPSYDHTYVDIVGETGVYTIVYEVTDAEGNLWGELKSGIGWIDLSALKQPQMLVSAGLVRDSVLEADYDIYLSEDPQFAEVIYFQANEDINVVEILSLAPGEDGYTDIQTLADSIPVMKAGEILQLSVMFAGDMTTYGLRVLDEDGEVRYFSVSISGRNGELIFEEYMPS